MNGNATSVKTASILIIMILFAVCPTPVMGQDPNYHVIFGNRDGSPLEVPIGQIIEIPIWGATEPGNLTDSIVYIHIPLATDNSIISARLGGSLPDTLLGRWDDCSFQAPIPDTGQGWTN